MNGQRILRVAACLMLLPMAGCAVVRPLFPARDRAPRTEPEPVGIEEQVGVPEPEIADDLARGVAYRLKVNDPVQISLSGIREPRTMNALVDEYGYIQLPYIDPVFALGKTGSELERDIREAYVANRIYRSVTVHVMLPSSSYFVRGEVRSPGRYPLTSGITLLQAVAAAGGYTDHARISRVRILRSGETLRVNLRSIERDPSEDLELKTDDVVVIPRSFF